MSGIGQSARMLKRIVFPVVLLSLAVGGCGSVKLPSLTTGSVTTASSGTPQAQAAAQPPPDDPVARAVRVGVISARAQKCGYHFDPQQLRSSFLAAEAQRTPAPDMLQKVERAHDFARQKVAGKIAQTQGYCTAERTAVIKSSLTRYLAGDFSLPAKKRQVASGGAFDWFGDGQPPEKFNPASIHDPLLNDRTKKAE